MEPPKKISLLKAAAETGDWRRAISIAAKFARLGAHKERITRAHNAFEKPNFNKQIGKDPTSLVIDGVKALKERYNLCQAPTNLST
jgi:hypothetical protein